MPLDHNAVKIIETAYAVSIIPDFLKVTAL